MIINVDDLFVKHQDVDELTDLLGKLLVKFLECNLRLHPKKMNVATSSANFIGYILTQNGFSVDMERCKIIREYRRPRTRRILRNFLESVRTSGLHRVRSLALEMEVADAALPRITGDSRC